MPSSFMRRRICRKKAEHIWSTVVIGVRGQESVRSSQETESGGGGELADEDV